MNRPPTLLTGANGFIGANTLRQLAEEGRSVIACDLYPEPSPAHARYFPDLPIHFVDRDKLQHWLETEKPTLEAVIHLGACSDTTVRDRDQVMAVNYEFSRMLFRWCTEHRVPMVYASSAATYGDGSAGFDDRTPPADLTPINLYGESKNEFDRWALEQTDTPPHWAGVKYFNVYGPFEQHKGRMASMAFHWFNQIRETGQARLFKSHRDDYADGEQLRDFIYVRDAVAATLHLLRHPDTTTPGVYNVGTGSARTFADLARAVFTAMDLEPNLVFIDMPEDLRAQYQYYTRAETAKLQNTGFDQPFTTLEEGVRQYVEHQMASIPDA